MTEESLFAAARQRPDPRERRAFLDEACGADAALRQRLEELLVGDEQARGILECGPEDAAPDTDEAGPPLATSGLFAGRFKLRQRLGAGGMGEVWVADQTEPVQRRVALKVVRPGLDSASMLARFDQERQALALMDHPNVARVLDAGIDDAGRPYFVMELIKGAPITDYCDTGRLSLRDRLELFVPVCQAVQHAHQKGIIHRDLKPSNILVALYDGRPIPKVIDFGVAKATGPRLTEQSIFTEVGSVIGTLEYMSPEQAELNNLDVDTRTDVYSLGVLLYELLTGTTPLDPKRVKEGPLLEVLRIIREDDTIWPSARLSTVAELPSVAAKRGAEPRKLNGLVRGELDWIVMRALEKDRNRRYATASAFADDVQHYLADEPVLAGPPGAGYRVRKFLGRHRGPVLGAAVVLLALVAGVVGLLVGLVEARRQGDLTEQARKEEADQRRRTEWLLYASQVNLAQQAWDNNNAALALHYLETCRPDFRGWEHDYLYTLFHGHQRTLGTPRTFRETGEPISSVAVSADGKRVVSGSDDWTVRVWDVDTGRVSLTLMGHTEAVTCVGLSPDGKRIASGGRDNVVRVWDAATGRSIVTYRAHSDHVNSVAFSPDSKRVVSSSQDRTVREWDADTGREILVLSGPNFPSCASVILSPDGRRVIGASNSVVTIWDAATGKAADYLEGHGAKVTALDVSSDGKRIVSGSEDCLVKVWNPERSKKSVTLWGHTGPVTSVTISPNGKWIVSGGIDRTVRVWDADTGRELRTLRGHTDQVSGVAMSADGKRVVSGSHDMTVKVWDAVWDGAATRGTRTRLSAMGKVSSLAVSPDGRWGASGYSDRPLLEVWDITTGQNLRAFRGGEGSVTGVAFSPDGRRLASANADGTVRVLDAADGDANLTLQGHTDSVTSVSWSPDGKRLASGSMDRTARVWDAATGRQTLTLPWHTQTVLSVAWSPDGRRIVSGDYGGAVRIWDAGTGQVTLTLQEHAGPVSSVAFSPHGERLASGSHDGTVRIWEADTGREVLALRGHGGVVYSVTWSPDGRRVFSSSFDGTVKVWGVAAGYETLTLTAHPGGVTGLALSPDGRRLLTGSPNGSIKVWDASLSQQRP
jgi:eukaryotic-like serine/threonine-protein kinase